jgi:hypothetical protein
MRTTAAIGFGLLLIASTSSIATAAPILVDSGVPDQRFIYFGDTNHTYIEVAPRPFTLSLGAETVAGVNWWGGCYSVANTDPGSPASGPATHSCGAGSFVIKFYEDNAGQPGTLVQSFAVGGAGQTPTGDSIGTNTTNPLNAFITEYSYGATFAPLTLVAGDTYWLSISNAIAGTFWGMESAGGEDSHQQFNGTAWFEFNDNLAYQLLGPNGTPPVPEPATWSLLAVAVGAMAVHRYRRRVRR